MDNSGYAWRHPRTSLRDCIKNGSEPEGEIPAQGGKLSIDEIDAVIAWFQSQWPHQLYGMWYGME